MAPAANHLSPASMLVLLLALHRAGAVSQRPLVGEWQEQYIGSTAVLPAPWPESASSAARIGKGQQASSEDSPEPQRLLADLSQASSATMLDGAISGTEKLLAQGRSDIRSLTEALLALDQFTKGAVQLEQSTGSKMAEMENTIAVLTRSNNIMKTRYSDLISQIGERQQRFFSDTQNKLVDASKAKREAEESKNEVLAKLQQNLADLRQLQEQQAQQSEQWSADRERMKVLATKATGLYKQWTSDRNRMQQLAEARKVDAEKAKVWQQKAYAAEQAREADVEQAKQQHEHAQQQHEEELGATLKQMQEAEARATQARTAQQLAEEEAVRSRTAQQLAEEESVRSRTAQQLAEEAAVRSRMAEQLAKEEVVSVWKTQEHLQRFRAEHS